VTPYGYSRLVRRAGKGKKLTIRAVNTLRNGAGGAVPDLQAVGYHAAGVFVLTLDLAGKRLTGGLYKGATLLVGIISYTLATSAEVPASPAAPRLVVTLTTPLAAPLADNASVGVGTAPVDFVVYRSRATANATADAPKNTSAGRTHFVIPAYGLPLVPTTGMLAIVDGEVLTIHDARPRGPAEVLGWVLAVGSKGAA
jgi:hypothetical protein